jgi:hypothetical protein
MRGDWVVPTPHAAMIALTAGEGAELEGWVRRHRSMRGWRRGRELCWPLPWWDQYRACPAAGVVDRNGAPVA